MSELEKALAMIAAGNSAALVIATQTNFKNDAEFCQAILNELSALKQNRRDE